MLRFEDIPDSVRRECSALKLDREKLDQSIEVLYNITKFLFKDSFPVLQEEPNPARRQSYAPETMLTKARSVMKRPDKNLKKVYKKLTMTGSGGFGSVYVAKDTVTKRRVALKKLPHNSFRSRLNNESEVFFLSECKHRNIVEMYQCYLIQEKDQPEEIWIVMEFMEGGTLAQAAKTHTFSDKHIAYTARECLTGIKYLHDKGFAHRDLKSTNVMMSVTGEIKLIDFGLCADFSEGPRVKMLGSPYWIPPEMIWNKEHSYPVDIWSLAVCILELYLMAPPHSVSALKCMYYTATEGLVNTIPERASKEARDFLSKCLVIDPNKRATAAELLQHPWVTQSNLDKGLIEILRQVFLSNSLQSLGLKE